MKVGDAIQMKDVPTLRGLVVQIDGYKINFLFYRIDLNYGAFVAHLNINNIHEHWEVIR